MPPGHALHADGQRNGHDGGQPLGNGGHRQAHSGHEHLARWHAPHPHAKTEQQGGGHQDDPGQAAAHDLHLAQQRGGGLLHLGQHVADAAHLGVRARGHHHGPRLPLRHQRARKAHAQAVAQRGIGGHGLGVLVHRHRFAGEGGFVHPQVVGIEQPHIGGQAVARGQLHHIAGHQVGGIQVGGVAIAQHHRVRAEQVADGLQRRLGLAFLHKPDHRIQHHHGGNHARVHPVAHESGDGGGRHQYVQQQVVELAQQAHQRTGSGRRGQAVGAVGRQALLGLGLGQPLRRGGQRGQCGIGGLGVPHRGGIGRRRAGDGG